MLLLLLLAACKGPASDDTRDSWHTDPACDIDADGDGSGACDDCDDGDPLRHPGAVERCNGLDDDCDGAPLPDEVDADGDGILDCAWCDEAGFWAPTREQTSQSALRSVLAGATALGSCEYSQSTTYMFLTLDNVGSQVECVYTGRKTSVTGEKPDATNMNTEHSWPQSQGAGEVPARCDLHHLYPTDADANNVRGNLPFGRVNSGVTWSEGGSRQGKSSAGAQVFEPRDAHKGNVARSMLYFALRYGHTLPRDQVELFLDWHAQDPPNPAEIARSLAIGDFQAAANPYVVCPDIPERAER